MHVCSVVSNPSRPHGLLPARLLCSWDSPGKNTRVGCDSLLQGIFQPRDPTHISCVSCTGSGLFAPELPGKHSRKKTLNQQRCFPSPIGEVFQSPQ